MVTQNSTSRSTRERDGRILLAIKIKARTAKKKVEKSRLTFLVCDPANAYTFLTSIMNGMTTHTHSAKVLLWATYTTQLAKYAIRSAPKAQLVSSKPNDVGT